MFFRQLAKFQLCSSDHYNKVDNLILSICAGCCRDRGERTREAYEQVVKPDYSKLFSIDIWMDYLLTGTQKKK